MYLDHFGLGVNPFSLSPKLDFLYKSGTFEESMAHLVYGLDNHEAIVLITGAIGTGKTMALQSFLTNLGPRFEFALITNTRVTAIELLKLVLEDLGVGLPIGADKSDLLILFKDYLLGASREGQMVLIVVDEAQNLAPDVLEEIRLLTNLGQGEAQPVQIILVGQPELEETVNRHDLAQIRQRIRVHYHLDPLTRQETEEYLNHRMAVAGCNRNVFSHGAIDRIFTGSHGVPRLVNTMAGEALLSAFVAGHEMVQPGDVEEDQDLRFATGPAPTPADLQPPVQQPVAPPPPFPVAPQPVVQQPVAPPPPAPQPFAQQSGAPQPEPTPQVAPPPLHGPQSAFQAPGYQVPPLPSAPVEIPRRPSHGMWKVFRPWFLGALLVLVLILLYNAGALDGLVNALYSRTEQGEGPTQESATEASLQKPSQEQAEIGQGNPESPNSEQGSDQDSNQQETEQVVTNTPKVVDTSASPAKERETPDEIVPGNKGPVTSTSATDGNGYYVHIYSFRTPERADSFVRNWDNPEDSLFVLTHEVRGVAWHRVYLGPYPTQNEALIVALRLKQNETISYFKVVQLSDF